MEHQCQTQLARMLLEPAPPWNVEADTSDSDGQEIILDSGTLCLTSSPARLNLGDSSHHVGLSGSYSDPNMYNQYRAGSPAENPNKTVLYRVKKLSPLTPPIKLNNDKITLSVNGTKVDASKSVLSEKSDYFKAMFSTDMKESKQNEIELTDVDADAVQAIVQFCHQEVIELSMEHVHNILHAAHQFQIFNVIEACEMYLITILRKDNILEILDLADHYCASRLLKKVYAVLRNNFVELCIRDTLLHLKYEQLLALLECDLPINASEFEIFKLVKKWIAEEKDERVKHIKDLLCAIKFPLITKPELSQLAQIEEEWLKQSSDFQEQVNNAFRYKNQIHEQPLCQTWQTIPRGAQENLIMFSETDAILSANNTLACNMLVLSDWNNNKSTKIVERDLKLEWRRDSYALVVWNNFLFVAGGFDPEADSNLSAVHRYDPRTCTWTRVQSMLHRRASFYLGVLGEHLYAVGGRQHDSVLYDTFHMSARTLSTVEMYDCHVDSWRKRAALPVGLYAHAGATCGDTLYICGGRTDHLLHVEDTNAVMAYNAVSDEWMCCPGMHHNRYYHAVISHRDKLYVMGGIHYNADATHGMWKFVQDIECFDSAAQQWTLLAPMPHRRSQLGLAVIHNNIYVIGGLPFPGIDGRLIVLEYNVEKNEWRPSSLHYPTFWPTTCCILKLRPNFIHKQNT